MFVKLYVNGSGEVCYAMDGKGTNTMIYISAFFITVFLVIFFMSKLREARKEKLRDNHMKVTVEMLDLVYQVAPKRYQLKMVYAHPKDGRKRYYMTESLPYDPVMHDDVKLDYEYDMYVHPDDPRCYYVDVSRYVRGYPPFSEWIKG